MSSVSHDNERRLLEAAMTLFARHGYRRTSMGDIAGEARVARATLYLRFRDKPALFEALGNMVTEDALVAADGAWLPEADLAANLEAMLLAKDLPFHRLLHATPHGAELLGVDAALTQANAARLDQRFTALLTRRAAEAEQAGADLSAFGGADGFAGLLALTGSGLKLAVANEAEYRTALHRLCRVAAHAAGCGVLRG